MKKIYKNKKVISKFKSPSEDIPAMSEKTLSAYWDTGNITKGKYNASIMVHYGNQTKKNKVEFDISEEKINIIGTGNIVSNTNPSKNSRVSLFVIIAIFVLIIVVTRFVYLRKKFKKEMNHKYYGY